MTETTPILPAHIDETIQAIARLHAEHYEQATLLQRSVDRVTAFIAEPFFVAALTVAVVVWIAGNLLAMALGYRPIDEPPFNWLQGAVGLGGLYVAVLILTTQRREDLLAGYREQLTLELSILSEQKTAKIIELLEEMRRDAPTLRNRHDAEAEEMAKPSDPQAVLDAIKNAHSEQDEIDEEKRDATAQTPAD